MTIEAHYSEEARNGTYIVTYYCYNDRCPVRTPEKPYPRSDGERKYITVISKKGNPYRKKTWICKHCGEEMQGTINANDFA